MTTASDERTGAGAPGGDTEGPLSRVTAIFSGPSGRNLGLVIALLLLCLVGVITAGDRFVSFDNVMTILRLASVIGVVSVGMTFVITGRSEEHTSELQSRE